MSNKSRLKPLILISGLSGVGKTAILDKSSLTAVVSDTTRPIREGETNGYDYNFRTIQSIMHDNSYRGVYTLDPPKDNYGHIYCATDKELLTKDAFIVDIKSAITLREQIPAVIVWIDGEQRDTRGRKESNGCALYQDNYDYCILNNTTITAAIYQLHCIAGCIH
ncbi:MAG: hypothetical protein ACXADH_15410 [Candidatus Kariarchaeaceae archaeon]|jgi:guanylate kinase